MFRHQGKSRTLKHNLQIASLLSFVAGIVNVSGFLAVQRLTTNITGHFAFFVDEVFKLNFLKSFIYFIYIFCFFLGSFTSSFLIEYMTKKRHHVHVSYLVPVVFESMILLFVSLFGYSLMSYNPEILVFLLLFSMGLQNSLVTKISNATVRTTHLTGLFTDLGIELSQMIFYKQKEQQNVLISSIKLRLTIISFFFFGGLLSGILYSKIKLYTLTLAASLLFIGAIYDDVKFKILQQARKHQK